MYFVFFNPGAPVDILGDVVQQSTVALQPNDPPLKVMRCTSVEWIPGGPVRLQLQDSENPGPTAYQLPPSWVLLVGESRDERAFGFQAAA